jgi:hypothetical protein
MSTVIEMRAWKASHTRDAAPASLPESPSPESPSMTASAGQMLYFCRACGSERFRIFESGVVRCGQCDAELRRTAPSLLALSVLPFFLPFSRWWCAPLTGS